MATPFIAANWKMNTTIAEASDMVDVMMEALCSIAGVEKVICPPFISLDMISKALDGTPIKVGAQNMYFEENGAYTGEISPMMLQGLCQYVIVGHSERRHILGEDDRTVNRKVHAALKVGLCPIVCVGEQLVHREAGCAGQVIRNQIYAALEGVSNVNNLVVAYEPVWAIGTGRPATGADAAAMMGMIRALLTDLFHENAARRVPLLYGGSVTADNIDQFILEEHVDGALVGSASLKPTEFVEIVRRTAQVCLDNQ